MDANRLHIFLKCILLHTQWPWYLLHRQIYHCKISHITRDGLAAVSAELGRLCKYHWVCEYGSYSCLEVLLSPSSLHSVADAKAGALACKLKGIGLWPGRGLDVGHAQIPT
jgi:hypothetical protein